MKDNNNRVLTRWGARELKNEELDHVSGSLPTDTVCTWIPPRGADGDASIGEC